MLSFSVSSVSVPVGVTQTVSVTKTISVSLATRQTEVYRRRRDWMRDYMREYRKRRKAEKS